MLCWLCALSSVLFFLDSRRSVTYIQVTPPTLDSPLYIHTPCGCVSGWWGRCCLLWRVTSAAPITHLKTSAKQETLFRDLKPDLFRDQSQGLNKKTEVRNKSQSNKLIRVTQLMKSWTMNIISYTRIRDWSLSSDLGAQLPDFDMEVHLKRGVVLFMILILPLWCTCSSFTWFAAQKSPVFLPQTSFSMIVMT